MDSSKKSNRNSRPNKKKPKKKNYDEGKKKGGAPRKYNKNSSKAADAEAMDPIPGNQSWGGLARKGVLRVHHDDKKAAEMESHQSVKPIHEEEDPDLIRLREERAQRRDKREARKLELQAEAKAALQRANANNKKKKQKSQKIVPKQAYKRKPLSQKRKSNQDLSFKFSKVLGAANGQKAFKKLREADTHFQQEKFLEANKKLAPLLKSVPTIAEVHELHGLICYRLAEYAKAATSLEQYRTLAQSTERHPILMDCYRSQHRWEDVKFLWSELADVSPDAATVAEGRIIHANSFADQGNFPKAINILEKGWKAPSRPQEHHLRKAYALADLYDRAAMPVKSRELFGWIQKNAPSYLDAAERYKQLA